MSLMQQLFDNPSSFYEENELREKHLQVKSKCLDQFTNAAIGAEETWRLIASQLEQVISIIFYIKKLVIKVKIKIFFAGP